MSSVVPPRSRPLRSFLIALGVLVLGLAIFVFGVSMEATATAPGVIVSRGEVIVRSPAAGVVSMGTVIAPGDEVKPGQVLAKVDAVEVRVPAGAPLSIVTDVAVGQGDRVEERQRLVTLNPLDSETHRPTQLIAWLDVAEEHVADVHPGQTVRLTSNLYNERIHGQFEAVIERIEPVGRLDGHGKRIYRVVAVVKETPLQLMLGSGVKAEIVIGKKRVWRIILEH
jgi:hypothetical protein